MRVAQVMEPAMVRGSRRGGNIIWSLNSRDAKGLASLPEKSAAPARCRERGGFSTSGERLALDFDPARLDRFGLGQRERQDALRKLGKKGDIVVFNLDEIGYRPMKKVFDVPDEHAKDGLTWRWTRDAAPMRLTLVNGTPTFEQGRFTGALPGEMLSPALA